MQRRRGAGKEKVASSGAGSKRPAKGASKKKEQEPTAGFDHKTQGRVLRFLNEARHAEDLKALPQRGIHVMAERRGYRGPDLHEPEPEHEKDAEEHERALDIDVARKVIDWRRENGPLHGFQRFEDVVRLIPRDLLHRLLFACGPAVHGRWDDPIDIPGGFDRPVHAAVVNTSQVLFFGLPNGDNTFLWDATATGASAFSPTANAPGDSLFCAGHAFLSDGKLLVVGGGGDGTGLRHNHGWKFDPGTTQWARTVGNGSPGNGDMAYPRWYPTLVTMGDEPGRVLVVSGDDGGDVEQMEVYFETSDRFERVWGPGGTGDTSANHSFPQLYPGLNLLPGGEVFYSPTGWAAGGTSFPQDYPAARPSTYFKFATTSPPVRGTWTTVPAVDPSAEDALDRVKGMAVMFLRTSYPFVQVMIVGGGDDPESATTYQLINLSEFGPEWSAPMAIPDGLARVNVNVVLLPDNTAFICGGRPLGGSPPGGGPCWIYDPAGSSWYEMDAISNSRRYHSVAVLLPDARVGVAGDEEHNDRTIEVFNPPYLFNPDGSLRSRPQITSTSPPELVHHGHSLTIETPDAPSIRSVVFVRPMAVTHQTDSEQRVIPLSFHHAGPTTLTATAPDGWHPHAIAPRGYYMLFLVDNDGTPSVARFMFLH